MQASMFTLQQLLRLSFANSVIWPLKQPKEAVPVRWVVLPLEEIGPGDVLLIPGSELTQNYLMNVDQNGGAAIICWGKISEPDFAFSSVVPIALVPDDQDFKRSRCGLRGGCDAIWNLCFD